MAVGNSIPFMGYNSALGIGKQLTATTFVTSTTFLEFNSESFKTTTEEVKLESINTNRDYTKRILGNTSVEGSVDFDLDIESDACINIIKNALGGTVTSVALSAAVSFTHTLRVGDMENNATTTAADSRGLSVAVRKGSTHTWDFALMKVNSLAIKGEIGSPIVATAEMIGQSATLSNTIGAAAISYTTFNPCTFNGVTIGLGASIGNLTTQYFTGFEFTINNNLDGDVRSLGSRNVTQIPAVKRDVTLTLSQRFDTSSAYDWALANTQTAIQITLSNEQTITTSITVGSLIINLAKCFLNTPAMPEVGDSGVLSFDIEVSSINDATYDSVQMTLLNGTADYD